MTSLERVVGDRFEIESLVQADQRSGVFRAHDMETGRKVALKVLRFEGRPSGVERFLREAEALARLRHEGIAAYVAHGHGQNSQNEVYLATEWLEGEDLGKRLGRKPLTLSESLMLVHRVAEALAVAHAQGVVHGELRPSKLLLREGRVEGVALLDYGITPANLAERTVTGTKEIVATLCYLAPEQARGERPGPSADIYSLGCVLFECLTGSPPHRGGEVAMALAQILYEELPRLGQLRSDLPVALEALLARMLAKQPRDRVADGQALVAELREVRATPEQEQASPGTPVSGAPVSEEQRLVSVMLAMPSGEGLGAAAADAAADADRSTVGTGPSAGLMARLEQVLRPYGSQVEGLADGSVMMMLSQRQGTAVDQAVQAARAAQAVRPLLEKWPMALATGRGTVSGAQLIGEVAQRAVELLLAHAGIQGGRAGSEAGDEARAQVAPPVWLDELTAGLLDSRFIVRQGREGWVLDRERMGAEEVRLLLGRRTPYVGREQELELLTLQLRACVEESVARGTLVLAASGVGKSRLRQEFLRRVEEQAEDVVVLLGRGDPMRGGSAYGLLGQALLEHCQLGQAAGPGTGRPRSGEDRRRRFAEVVGRHVAERDRQQVVEFLGEMCGVPFADDHRPQLRAARQDPRLMSDQVTAAWIKLLQAECAAHPVLLVLEDLHWSDRATLRLVEAALRELAETRLMVLAFARPEVKEMFPGLWQDAQVQEMRLPVLGQRASERLVQEVLGALATEEVVARIVKQAGGNALFLEELIRAAAEGREGQPAETVLAMLQARIGRLEPGMRRVLEMASLMGETFWRGGVIGLLGAAGKDEREWERWLQVLVGAETIVRRGTSRFAGETEYAFRHALVRDAAYGLLGEEERRAGHRLVGRYLEEVGERDLMVLAEHHWLGGDEERAASYFARAAVQAMEANDLVGTLRCVERGVACGAAGEVLGGLRAAETWAQLWSGNFVAAHTAGVEAFELLPPGSDPWYQAFGPLMVMAGSMGQKDVLAERARAFVAAPLTATPSVIMEAGAVALFQLCLYGERALMEQMTGQLRKVGARLTDSDTRTRGMLFTAFVNQTMLLDGDLGSARGFGEQALALFSAVGDARWSSLLRSDLALIRTSLGDDKADLVAEFRAGLSLLEELRQMTLADAFLGLFAIALAVRCDPSEGGYLAEAEAMAQRVLGRSPYPSFWTGLGHLALAEVWARRGELSRAEAAARQALPMFPAGTVGGPLGQGVLSRVLLAQGQGRLDEALGAVEEGLGALRALGGRSFLDSHIYLAAVEAYQAAGNTAAAREALAEGVQQMDWRAARIPDPAARMRFLTDVKDNVRLLELQAAG
jgi:hypothetical protein